MADATHVRSGHLHQSGFVYKGRASVRGISATGSASASSLEIFDTLTAPIAATYGRAGTTITVAKTAHGLVAGDRVGISFGDGTGAAATPGNYTVVSSTANAFVFTDMNSGTVTAGTACRYVHSTNGGPESRWMFTKEFSTGDSFANIFDIPGRGLLAQKGIYMHMSSTLATADVFYEG